MLRSVCLAGAEHGDRGQCPTARRNASGDDKGREKLKRGKRGKKSDEIESNKPSRNGYQGQEMTTEHGGGLGGTGALGVGAMFDELNNGTATKDRSGMCMSPRDRRLFRWIHSTPIIGCAVLRYAPALPVTGVPLDSSRGKRGSHDLSAESDRSPPIRLCGQGPDDSREREVV